MENTAAARAPITWKIHFVDDGPLSSRPGRVVKAYAESSEDGRWLLVATFNAYHRKPEDNFFTLYPARVERNGYMNVGKQTLDLRDLERRRVPSWA